MICTFTADSIMWNFYRCLTIFENIIRIDFVWSNIFNIILCLIQSNYWNILLWGMVGMVILCICTYNYTNKIDFNHRNYIIFWIFIFLSMPWYFSHKSKTIFNNNKSGYCRVYNQFRNPIMMHMWLSYLHFGPIQIAYFDYFTTKPLDWPYHPKRQIGLLSSNLYSQQNKNNKQTGRFRV